MRILRLRIRNRILVDRARLRIELADQCTRISRVPDVAVLILDQPVWTGVRSLERIFLELARLRVEPAEDIGHLAGVPERAVSSRQRIVWPRSGGGYLPFLDRDLRRPVDDDPRGLALFREVLAEIFGERGKLVGRDVDALVDHHPQHGRPALGRIAGTDATGEGVAAVALRRDDLLALAFRQILAPRRKQYQRQRSRDQGAMRWQIRQTGFRHGSSIGFGSGAWQRRSCVDNRL